MTSPDTAPATVNAYGRLREGSSPSPTSPLLAAFLFCGGVVVHIVVIISIYNNNIIIIINNMCNKYKIIIIKN